MFRRRFVHAMQRLALMLALLSINGRAARAQDPAAMPMPNPAMPAQPAAAPPAGTTWLMSGSGGMPWQVGAMFTGFWVLTAAEIAIISKSAGRLDKPKKKDPDLQAD
jgi:hypothetical protein